jgi:hexosaminidase
MLNYTENILSRHFVACNPAVRKAKTDVVLSIVPQPKEVRVFEGGFILDAKIKLVFSTEEQGKVANWFNKELQNVIGLSCGFGTGIEEKNTIVLTQVDSLVNEAYLLDIDDGSIAIKASSEAGYFYAFQTMLQLAPVV